MNGFHRTGYHYLQVMILGVLLLSGSVWAGGRPSRALTTEQAREVATKAGVPIMIVYMDYRTTEPEALAFYRTLLNAPGANRQFVIAEVDYNQMDDLAEQTKGKFPTWSFRTVPYYAFIDPDGKFMAGGNSYNIDDGGFERDRKEVLAKCPPFPKTMQDRVQTALDRAAQCIDAYQYQQASMLIERSMKGVWFPQTLIDRGTALGEFVEEQGRQMLTKADNAARDDKVHEAMLAYDQIIDAFGSSSERGREAARSLRQLQIQHATEARDYHLARPGKMAEWYMDRANALAQADHLDAALTLCTSIMRSYGRTESAEPAMALMQTLRQRITKREEARRAAPDAEQPEYKPLGM